MKAITIKDALITYPKLWEAFDIHTDASDYQISGVVSQNSKSIAYFSRKFNTAQMKYIVIAKELLALVETLANFRSMLLGQVIKIWTDHKNLTYENTDFFQRPYPTLTPNHRIIRRYYKFHIQRKQRSRRNPLTFRHSRQRSYGLSRMLSKKVLFAFDVTSPLRLFTIAKEQKTIRSLKILQNKSKNKNFRQLLFNNIFIWTMINPKTDECLIYVSPTLRE